MFVSKKVVVFKNKKQTYKESPLSLKVASLLGSTNSDFNCGEQYAKKNNSQLLPIT